MAYKCPICDVFHWFCKIARFFATEPLYDCDSLKGFIIFLKSWKDPKLAYLVEIAIEKNSQGKGSGSYLLSQSLFKLQKRKLSTVDLTVDPNNKQAKHIYCDKFGFESVKDLNNEYGQGKDRLLLRLDLEKWTPKFSNFPS